MMFDGFQANCNINQVWRYSQGVLSWLPTRISTGTCATEAACACIQVIESKQWRKIEHEPYRHWWWSKNQVYPCLSSRGPESFQQRGRVGRTSGDRFPPLCEAFDGLLFGSPIRFGSVLFAIWVLRRADLVAFFSNCQNNFASTIKAHAWQSQAALGSEKTFADTWSCCRSGSIYNPVCGCGTRLLSMRLLLDVRGLPGGQRLRAVWAKHLEVCKVGRLALGQDLRSWLWDSWQAAAIRGRQLHGWCE